MGAVGRRSVNLAGMGTILGLAAANVEHSCWGPLLGVCDEGPTVAWANKIPVDTRMHFLYSMFSAPVHGHSAGDQTAPYAAHRRA